jgi:transcriptional regulator with XRE-family HTH domain
MTVAEQMGLNIRVMRTRKQLTQEQLAFAADMHPTYLSEIERGKRKVSVEMLLRLAKAMGCQPSELLEGLEAPEA